jgi:tripartite-type tricarboxylate transporter receptor subunit TctC
MKAVSAKMLLAVLVGFLSLWRLSVAEAQQPNLESWMKGKELRIVVPFAPGGGNDLSARIIARTGSKYFPGKPKITVVNVPGGGGRRGIRYAYGQPANGLTAAQLHPRFILQPLIGIEIEGFDPRKIRLLGNLRAGKSQQLICVRRTVATNWEEIMALKRPITFGDTGYGTSGGAGALFLQLIGAPVKVVTGYGGTSEIMAALDRGELDSGRACLIGRGDTVDRLYPKWLQKPTYIVPIAYHGHPPDEDRTHELGWKTPPLLFDLRGITYTKGQREALELNDLLVALGNHSVWLPTGVPDHMFQAWSDMLKRLETDPEFIELSKAGSQDVGYISGAELKTLIRRVEQLPSDGIAMLKTLNTGK